MTKRSFLTELGRGVEAEQSLITHLTKLGFTLHNWAQEEAVKTNKGPKLNGFIIPDLLVSRDNKWYWIDSKRKDAPVFYGVRREWRHGIDGKCYWNYLEIQNLTNIPVWICFIEPDHIAYSDTYSKKIGYTLDTGGYWFTPLDATPVKQDVNKRGYKDMVYWDRATMKREIE
jgi:hypothetical protein